MRIFLSAFFICVSLCVCAQTNNQRNNWNGGGSGATTTSTNSREGFTYGLGMGFCFASGKNALFYNGAPDKQNNIDRIIANPYVYPSFSDSIYRLLGNSDYKIVEYPTKISYKPTIGVNGYLGYVLQDNTAVIFQIQYARFKTTSVFVLQELNPANNTQDFTNYVDGSISSNESRVDFELGYKIPFATTKTYMPYVIFSGNLNSVQVKSQMLQISTQLGTFSQSMIYSYNDPSYIPTVQGGMGYGGSVTLGVEIPSKKKVFYSLGLHGSMKRIHLLDNAGLTPHGDIFVAVMF